MAAASSSGMGTSSEDTAPPSSLLAFALPLPLPLPNMLAMLAMLLSRSNCASVGTSCATSAARTVCVSSVFAKKTLCTNAVSGPMRCGRTANMRYSGTKKSRRTTPPNRRLVRSSAASPWKDTLGSTVPTTGAMRACTWTLAAIRTGSTPRSHSCVMEKSSAPVSAAGRSASGRGAPTQRHVVSRTPRFTAQLRRRSVGHSAGTLSPSGT